MEFESSSSSNSSDSDSSSHSDEMRYRPFSFMKPTKLVSISNLSSPTELKLDDKTIIPFKNMSALSFAQRDKYIFELGWFLKHQYGDKFKSDWVYYRLQSAPPNEPVDIWEKINPQHLYIIDFNLDLHSFAMKLFSLVYPRFQRLYNENKDLKEIKKNIKHYTSETSIYALLEDEIKNIFFIKEDRTSYIFNQETKLYKFNSSFFQTLETLNVFINRLKSKINELQFFIDNEHNQLILTSFLKNLSSLSVKQKLIQLIKRKDEKEIVFNNQVPYEIAYKDRVLNLKDGTTRERTCFDYYLTSINQTYLRNYNKIPSYIRSIFGDNKDEIRDKQILLGSLFTGEPSDYFVLFYGKGGNSKTKFLLALKEIFNDFQLNMDYETYIIKKDVSELIATHKFEQKRLIAIDDLNPSTFLKDPTRFTRLVSSRHFNFIATVNEHIPHGDKDSIKRRLIEIEFPFKFVNNPIHPNEKGLERRLEINLDFLFTWLVKGTQLYFEQRKERRTPNVLKLEKDILPSKLVYSSDHEDFSDEEDDFTLTRTKPILVPVENTIISFVKENTILSPESRTMKRELYDLYTQQYGVERGFREFNNVVRSSFDVEEYKSHSVFYWIGMKLKDN